MRFVSLRGEGPHQLPQKRSLALVSIIQSLAPAQIANALHLRDFRSSAIFEFFNTIRQKPSFISANICGEELHCSRTLGLGMTLFLANCSLSVPRGVSITSRTARMATTNGCFVATRPKVSALGPTRLRPTAEESSAMSQTAAGASA